MQGIALTDPKTGKVHIEVSVKPDMNFAAAHSDVWGALGLDILGKGVKKQEEDALMRRHSSGSMSSRGDSDGGEPAGTRAQPLAKLRGVSPDAVLAEAAAEEGGVKGVDKEARQRVVAPQRARALND